TGRSRKACCTTTPPTATSPASPAAATPSELDAGLRAPRALATGLPGSQHSGNRREEQPPKGKPRAGSAKTEAIARSCPEEDPARRGRAAVAYAKARLLR